MDSKSFRRQNLALLETAHGSLAALERKTEGEVTASYLSQVKNGYREMGDKVARKLEERLSQAVGWMDLPHDIKEMLDSRETNAQYVPEGRSRLPLISWVSAGMKEEAFDPYAPGNAEEWVDFQSPATRSAFCLRVRGDSMVRPDGTGFPDGCIIAVEPKRKPKSREFAVFRFNDSDEATFKQYVHDGPLKMLKPLNPSYPVIALGPDAALVGTVFEMHMITRL